MSHHIPSPPFAASRRALLAAAVSVPQVLVVACASPPRLAAVPSTLTAQAQAAVPNARFYPDRNDPALVDEAMASYRKEAA